MQIEVELVTALIAAQFPHLAHLPVRAVAQSGWDNRTFRVGDALLARLPSAEHYVAQVEKEQQWLPLLAPQLPLPIPEPIARGEPGAGYSFPWSVYRWIEGERSDVGGIGERERFARELAAFLVALRAADAREGPTPGAHNFMRGAHPSVYDAQLQSCLRVLGQQIDVEAARDLWRLALASQWDAAAVWLHGDVATGNLLVRNGSLHAVIDFGCCAVGDPACDLAIAWTFFAGASREAFRTAIALDEATWARARGWVLWKSLLALRKPEAYPAHEVAATRSVIDAVLAEHRLLG